jgi:PAS domain S-box-containing protein/putative nucleotidyltransferase with HDIG domain
MVKKVLIVDDNSANLYMLESMLKGYGLEVTSAKNGKDALDKARLNPPDLIVTDILMPVMDGYALCRQWKSDDTLKTIPLIFYTATYTGPKDEKFALSLGADGFIIKPQEPDIFMDMLKEVLGEKYTSRQVVNKPLGEEMEFFRQHNETLFRKLEKKMSELEISNQKLKALEETYRLSFENVMDVIYSIDTDLNVSSVSPSVEKILGYKPQDFIGRSVLDIANILTPESFEQAVADIRMILKGETILASVYRFIAKDGTLKYGEVSGSPITQDGRITGLISVARDITDRRVAQEALQDREKSLATIYNTVGDVIFHLAVEPAGQFRFVSVNSAFLKVTGLSPEMVVGRTVNEIIPEPSLTTVLGKYQQSITENTIVRWEEISDYPTGRLTGIVSIAPVFDDNGACTHLVGSVQDITVRKQMEDALKESEDKFRSIFENSSSAMAIIERDTTISMVNKEYCRISLYDEKDVIGMSWTKQIPPEDLKRLDDYNRERRINPNNAPSNYEFSFYRKDGEIRNALISVAILPKAREVVASFVDITERKQAEAKLQQTLNSLEKAIGTTIQVLVSAVESRDPYTAGHQLRVADLARAIATEMGLTANKVEGIRMAGSIHDIGKLSIPAEILSKPTKLTNIEFSLIKEHPKSGYEMLKDVESPWPLAQIVYQHHERMNGSGYPRNLKGDEILIEARIMAVADVVEAMGSHRPYRPTLGIEAALEEIEKNRGILYDDAVANACLKLFREKGYRLT